MRDRPFLEFRFVAQFSDADLAVGFLKGGLKIQRVFLFTVDQPCLGFGAGDGVVVIDEFRVIRMAGEGIDLCNAGFDLERVSVDVDRALALADFPAERAFRAVTDEEDGVIRISDIVTQVVEDATGFAHAGCGDDNGRAFDIVEGLGAFDGADEGEVLEAEGVLAVEESLVDFLVKGIRVESVDFRGADRERAIDVDRDAREFLGNEKLVQHMEELLGALHCEGGDDDFSAAFDGAQDNFRKRLINAGRCEVLAAAVGAFHEEKVHVRDGHWIAKDFIAATANIAGEEEAFRLSAIVLILHVENDLGGAEDMAGIDESELDAIRDVDGAVIGKGHELAEAFFRILFIVEWLDFLKAFAFAVFVYPVDIVFLDACGIAEHDLAEIAGGVGAVDGAGEALAGKVRKVSAVIDMGVGEDHEVH